MVADIWIAAYFYDTFNDWRQVPVLFTAIIVFMICFVLIVLFIDGGEKTEWTGPR